MDYSVTCDATAMKYGPGSRCANESIFRFLLHARFRSRELRISTRVPESDRGWNLYDRHDSAREKRAETSL